MEKQINKGFTTHHYQAREREELLNIVKFLTLLFSQLWLTRNCQEKKAHNTNSENLFCAFHNNIKENVKSCSFHRELIGNQNKEIKKIC